MVKIQISLFKSISFHFFPLITIFILCTVLIISWFHLGLLYGGGDVGLPTYDPVRLLDIVKNIWWDAHAPGFPYPSALTAIPLYLTLVPLQALGLSNVAIQAIIFGSLLILSGVGMYALFLEVESSRSKILALIAAVFYMLNPYMISQIWHRFVHTAFFLTALLPILTFIYIRLVRTHNFYWFLGFLVTTFIFTYAFGSLPYMVVIWVPITLYSVWKRAVKTFILLFLSWVVLNVWWLYPFWTTGPAIFSEIHSLYASVSTLTSLSNQNSIPMVLRGINSFYIFGEGIWVPGYDRFYMQIISWTFPVAILLGIYSILTSRRTNFYVWVTLFLIGIFVSKGTGPPFGYPLLWLFSKSFLLGAFRNPFEKFGIIAPFASALIFPIGIQLIYSRFRKYLSIIVIGTLLLLEFVVYPWPAWLGSMFGAWKNPAFVEVPTSYSDANTWINNQGKEGRILHLPFAPGDAISYNWKHGYSGIDPNPLLFDSPSISHGFGLEFLDKSLGSINLVFLVSNFNEKKVADVLSILNVRYIVLHLDVDWKNRGLIDPSIFEEKLAKISFIDKKTTLGDLIIYEVDSSRFVSNAFTASVSSVLTGSYKYFSLWPEIYQGKKDASVFITPVNGNVIQPPFQNSLNYSAAPIQVIDIPFFPLAYKENALGELPQPRFLPGSIFYPLILLKEHLNLFASPILNRHNILLDLSGKRLAEAYLLTKSGNIKMANRTLADYMSEVNLALTAIAKNQRADLIDDSEMLILKRVFARHKILLEELKDEQNLENLKKRLSEMGFISYFDLKEDLGMSKYGRKVYRFDIKKKDDYEILLKSQQNKSYYENGLTTITLQIDDSVKTLTASQVGEFISLGKVALDTGLHEISYNMVDSFNLVPEIANIATTGTVSIDNQDGKYTFTFSTNKQESSTLSFPITGFDHNSVYRIDFDFWIQKGQGPILQFEQDSDWDVKGERFMDVNKLFDKGNYFFYWNSASVPLRPRSNTKEAVIRFVVEPWNNCFEILKDRGVCKVIDTKRAFNRESNFVIKNIFISRPFTDEIFLHSSNSEDTPSSFEKIFLHQIASSLYEGQLKLDQPTTFSLLTTFHPEWKLYLTKEGKSEIISERNHFLLNGYGNSWYLDQSPGEYKIKLEFLPQKRFYKGIIVSLVGTIILMAMTYKYYRKTHAKH